MASTGGTRVPELLACVVGLSRGRGENFTKHMGIGKSCLCYRFMYPGFDDYVDDHQSLLALHEFENAVYNNVHFLYWGSVVKRFPMKTSEKYTQIQFHVVEQTVFYQDVTSQPFTIITKPDSLDHYIKRITGPIESPGKVSYKSRNDTDYSQRQQYPSGLSRLPRGFMVVLDVSLAENEFEVHCKRVEQLLEYLMKHKRKYIIVAAKRDNYDFDSLERAHELKRKYRTQLIETSANGNLNVHDAFRLLACKTLHKKPHGLSDNIPTYEDAAHHILKAKGHVKRVFQTFLTKRVTDSDERLHSIDRNEEYQECKMLIGKFETNRLFAVHALQLYNEKISSYAGVLENPDMRQEFLEEFVDQRLDLTSYSQYLKNWIDSYMDELPSSESPESSQPEPETEVVLHPAVADPEPPEPYIMFEKPKPGVIHSPPHQPAESGTRSPPDNSQSKGTSPNEDDEAKRDSYYSDSSNFDDHDYENYDPKEYKLPGREKSAATTNQPPPSATSATPTLQTQLSGQEVSSSAISAGAVSPPNNGSQVKAQSSGSETVTTTISPPPPGNSEAQKLPKSPNFNDRRKLLEDQVGSSPPQSPEASQRKKGGPGPPPPVRKSSSLTRSNQSSSSSLQESPQLSDRSRKTSLPASPQLEPKSNTSIQRTKSIKLQAAKLQDLLSGKSSQNDADDEDEAVASSVRSAAALAREEAQKSNIGSTSPSARKLIKPNIVIPPVPTVKPKGVPQPGDSSPALSQGSINELKSRLDESLLHKKLGAEVVSKAMASGLVEPTADAGEEENSDAIEYKPRLQIIKARVEKRKQEAAQAQAVQVVTNQTNSNDAGDITSTSTFVSGVSRAGDVSPITIPPLVPPKPRPGRPSGDSTTKGLDERSSPLPPPPTTEETGGFMDGEEEEPPPLPARTSAMFELEKSPPKVAKRAHYTNVSVESDEKEKSSTPPPPPTDTGKKGPSKKKGTNYPRVLLKKVKDKKEKTPEPSSTKMKGKDTSSSPTQSTTRKTGENPTRKEQPILRSNSENRPRPSSGPVVHVRPPMFINMRERPLPQIPGEIDNSFEEPPDHTIDDYEKFELGQYYVNLSNNPSHNYEALEHQPPVTLPGRTVLGVQRAHSFNPGDKLRQLDPICSSPSRPSFDRSNFDPLPIPPPSPRSTEGGVPDYVDGYVNTTLSMQLPARGKELPSGTRTQPSDVDHPDYDYPDLRQQGFMHMAHTLPSRRKNPTVSPLAQPGISSRQWGSDGYPSIQRWPMPVQAPSEPDGEDRLDSDYVPMASVVTMDDSYINWETIKDTHTRGGVADQGQQQRVVPPRGVDPVGAHPHPHPGYAMDDMYVNMPHGTSSTANRVSAQEELAHKGQRLLPTRGFAPNTAPSQLFITPPVSSAETASIGRGASGAPPSPKPKPKARQRSATTAAAIDEALPVASVGPGSPLPPAPEQAWRMPPVMQPLVSQPAGQPGTDPSIYQNVDPSLSLPMPFGHHLRGGLERRSSESDMAIKPTATALPPRNIPRRPQH